MTFNPIMHWFKPLLLPIAVKFERWLGIVKVSWKLGALLWLCIMEWEIFLCYAWLAMCEGDI